MTCSYQRHVESAHLFLRLFSLVPVTGQLITMLHQPSFVGLTLRVRQPFPATIKCRAVKASSDTERGTRPMAQIQATLNTALPHL